MNVGIVVIGRNEGERLVACLASLIPAGMPIVYADSNSTDGSAETAERLGVTVVRLDPSRPMNAARGRKEGTNTLVALGRSLDYVFYIDGDCILQSGFLERAADFLDRHPRVAAVCGRRFEARPDASFYNRLCDEEWNTPSGRTDACGGDALMRLAAVLEVGGFDEELMASEEPELSARLRAAGWEIWRIDALMTEHDAAIFSFGAYWRRHLRGGVGYFQAWRKTAKLAERINGRTLRSAMFWSGVLPLFAIILALSARSPVLLLLLPIIYGLQIARMAVRQGAASWHHWKAAAALMAIKPAELLGAAKALLKHGQGDSIRYKGA